MSGINQFGNDRREKHIRQKRDETRLCKNCMKNFIHSAAEQKFFVLKGFTHKPLRCLDCRIAKKSTKLNDDELIKYLSEEDINPAVLSIYGKSTHT